VKQIDLSNKAAVVTGGAGRLGRVMVRELARCGASIAINYFSQEKEAQSLKLKIEQEFGVKAITVQADVTDFDSVAKMKNDINEALGHVDIVVNNSVIQYKWKPVLEQDLEDYEGQFKSCVMQGVHMAKVFIPDMINKKYGRFIGINTECAMQMWETQSAYVAGKRGMDGVYKVLAKEVGRYNITVNQVAPGWTICEGDEVEDNCGYTKNVPLQRRGTDTEIADAVCFLASDLASYITGVYLPVCGGNEMPCI